MKVSVNLHTILRGELKPSRNLPFQIEIADNWTVKNLLQELSLHIDPMLLIIVINGRVVTEKTILREGDMIDLVPEISGG